MLTGSLEDNVLTVLVHSLDHAATVALYVQAKLFSTRQYQLVADKALAYLETYRRPPGVHIRDLLEKDLARGEDGKLLSRVLQDMDELAPNLQTDYVISALTHFIDTRRLTMAMENAMEALQSGNLAEAREALYKNSYGTETTNGIWFSDTKAMLGFLDKDESDYFSCGVEELDRRGIRPYRKQLFLMIGPKKAGKSWWVVEAGKQGILHHKKVLHVTLENSEEITAQRYLQSMFAMTTGQAKSLRVPFFKKDQLGRFTSIDHDVRTVEGINADTRSMVAKRMETLKRAQLLIKEFPSGTLTIPHFNAYLDQLERVHKFVPDLVLVDSGNKMSVRGDHLRTDLGQVFTMLRGIASARNLALVTPTHSNRRGDMSTTVSGAAHVGEDYSMLGTADIVCTISRTAKEREQGLARILVDAARNAEDKWLALITQSYESGQFCIDSTYMSKHVESEVNRINGENEDGDET